MRGGYRYFFSLLKIVLLGLVIAILLHQIHWDILKTALARFDLLAITGVLCALFLRIFIQSYRMQYAARVAGVSAAIKNILRWELEILFLEIAIPLPDSEDMLRVFFWQKLSSGIGKTLSALLFSRLCGLMAISMILPFAFVVLDERLKLQLSLPPFVIVLVPLIFIAAPYLLSKILPFIAVVLEKISWMPSGLSDTVRQIAAAKMSPLNYTIGFLLSLLQLMCIAAGFYILVNGSGLAVSYWQLLAVTPLLILSFILPLSLQGLGLPEAAMVWILTRMGVQSETAAAIGMMHFACYIFLIITGAIIVFVFSDDRIGEIRQLARTKHKELRPISDK